MNISMTGCLLYVVLVLCILKLYYNDQFVDFKINFRDLGKAKEKDLSNFNKATKEVIIIDLTLYSKQLVYIRIRKNITMKNYKQCLRFSLVACGD